MRFDQERAWPTMRVASLHRYPVKSMSGQPMTTARIGPDGLEGDRRFALIDRESGRVVSAKEPRRWGVLLRCTAGLDPARPDRVTVTLPDGHRVTGPSPAMDVALSALTGRDVTLTGAVPTGAEIERYWPDDDVLPLRDTVTTSVLGGGAPGTFFDYAPLHLVSSAALEVIRRARAADDDQRPRFRPNVVIEMDGSDGTCLDFELVGRTLRLGTATIAIMSPTPRCVVPTLAQARVPRDPGVLRSVADVATVPMPGHDAAGLPCLGVYGTVSMNGTLRVGDVVTVVPEPHR